MDFALSETQEAVRRTFAGFSDREIAPRAAEIDKAGTIPRELFRQVGELGFFGMRYAEPDGSGMDVVSYALATEELARALPELANADTAHVLLVAHCTFRVDGLRRPGARLIGARSEQDRRA